MCEPKGSLNWGHRSAMEYKETMICEKVCHLRLRLVFCLLRLISELRFNEGSVKLRLEENDFSSLSRDPLTPNKPLDNIFKRYNRHKTYIN